MTVKKKDLGVAQLHLLVLWVAGVAPAVLILFFRTFVDHSIEVQKEWGWLLASTMPTLGLVMGAYTATPQSEQIERAVDLPFYHIALGISGFYLLIVNAGIFLSPLSDKEAIQQLSVTSVVLGPLQGLITAALGFFFIRRGNPKPDS